MEINVVSGAISGRALLLGALAGLALPGIAGAQSHPDWSGQWHRVGGLAYPPEGYDEAGPPPLTPEYQEVWESYQARKEEGSPAGDPPSTCLPPGMPRFMTMSFPMEIIITPDVTYIYGEWESQLRRIYTDGRDWDDEGLRITPSFNGYSIGEWRDEDGDGVYDLLSIETRAIEGDRSFDSSSVPLADNDSTVVLEEIRRVDGETLQNTITTRDDALTEPWTVDRRYRLQTDDVIWVEYVCVENNRHIRLDGDEWYFIDSDEGTLEPTRAGQTRLVPATED